MRQLVRIVFWTFLFTGASSVASAKGKADKFEAKEKAAKKACITGDVRTGIDLLGDLYVETDDITFVFNQGRCFEQNRQFEDAIGRFEEYLRAASKQKLGQADKAAAEKHIADCKESLAQQIVRRVPTAVPAPAQPPAQASAQPVPPTVAFSAPPSEPMLALQPATPRQGGSSPSGLRTAGIIIASIGGAALIAGVIFNLKVNSIASEMATPGGYSDGKSSERKTYETLGWVSYGVGGACIATGAVLYLARLKTASSSGTPVALVPVFTPGQAGAALKGAF